MSDRYYDNPVIRVMNRFTDLIVLNLLFLFCSIPVVTMGASLSAMYAVTLQSVRYGDGYVIPRFFRAFKANFRQATVAWIGILAIAGVLFADVHFWRGMEQSAVSSTMLMVSYAIGILVWMVTTWLFPLIAKMQDRMTTMVVNAMKFSVGYFFPYTTICMGLPAVLLFLAYVNGPMLMLMAVVGFATMAYICSFFFYRVFAKHIQEDSLGCEDVLYPQQEQQNNENYGE